TPSRRTTPNCATRARLARKSRCFSRSLDALRRAVTLFVHAWNRRQLHKQALRSRAMPATSWISCAHDVSHSPLTTVCEFSNNGASDCGRMVNYADCGRDVPAPQCPWFAMRPQSQDDNSQTLTPDQGFTSSLPPVVLPYRCPGRDLFRALQRRL